MPDLYCILQPRCHFREALEEVYGSSDPFCQKHGSMSIILGSECPIIHKEAYNDYKKKLFSDMKPFLEEADIEWLDPSE
jgi:hypothetical protein